MTIQEMRNKIEDLEKRVYQLEKWIIVFEAINK